MKGLKLTVTNHNYKTMVQRLTLRDLEHLMRWMKIFLSISEGYFSLNFQ